MWAICIKNIEAGKYELIEQGRKIDLDDPRYADEAHIVPVTQNGEWLQFGQHDFTRECFCHPQIQEHVYNRTLILHREAIQ